MTRHIYGYWDCVYCNTNGIRGDNRECPNCGHPRDDDVKFYIGNAKDIVPEDKKNDNPDWICQYCNSLNPSYEASCISCGAERTNMTYFQKSKKDDVNCEDYSAYNDEESCEEEFTDCDYATNDSHKDENNFCKAENNKLNNLASNLFALIKEYKSEILIGTGIMAAVVLLIWGICYMFIPYTTNITVDSFEWSRTIELEELRTFDESDWNLPSGAKLRYTHEEIHHYDKVLDHYEQRTRTVSKQVPDGIEVVGYRDLGNGQFEEQTRIKYKTVYEEETYEQPIYRDEPVYQIKYYYTIDRWVHWKDVETSGQDKTPYWGEVGVLDSKQREGARIEKYYLVSSGERYSVNYPDWNNLEYGQKLTVKVQRFGNKVVEIIL